MTLTKPGVCLADLDALIFDMDGVLIDSMPYHAQAWIAVLREIGVAITRDDVYAREGEPGAASLSVFLKQNGMDPDPETIRDLLARKERLFKQTTPPQPFNGVREFIAELRRLGKRLAIVTGTAREELNVSLPEDIRDQFEVIVTGDRIQRGKPDPEPYLTAVAELRVDPAKALVIENAPLGLRAAKAAGLRCWTVATSVACSQLTSSDRCFSDLASLADFLLP